MFRFFVIFVRIPPLRQIVIIVINSPLHKDSHRIPTITFQQKSMSRCWFLSKIRSRSTAWMCIVYLLEVVWANSVHHLAKRHEFEFPGKLFECRTAYTISFSLMVADRFLLRISEWADFESLVAVFNQRFWRGCVCFFGGAFGWLSGAMGNGVQNSVWVCVGHACSSRTGTIVFIMSLSFKKMDSGGLVGLKGHFYTGNGEVAWLEKKGYEYTAVEIDVAKWIRNSTARAIRRSEISPWMICMLSATAIEPNSWELRVAAACLRSNCNVDPMKRLHHIILCDFDWCQLDVATCKQML